MCSRKLRCWPIVCNHRWWQGDRPGRAAQFSDTRPRTLQRDLRAKWLDARLCHLSGTFGRCGEGEHPEGTTLRLHGLHENLSSTSARVLAEKGLARGFVFQDRQGRGTVVSEMAKDPLLALPQDQAIGRKQGHLTELIRANVLANFAYYRRSRLLMAFLLISLLLTGLEC